MLITVIGMASIDIFAKSKQQIVPGEANPANVSLRAGGDARNIASMLASRGADVSLITAVGDDALGALLKDSCDEIGINTDAWIIKKNMCTCVNLETQESTGQIYAGFYALTAPETIKPNEIIKHRALINSADLLILDSNLTDKILATAIEMREGGTVLVDAVSAQKAKRIENLLSSVNILKLNRRQAESLTGITLDSKDRVRQAGYSLAAKGVRRVFITLGVAGVCASDESSTIFVPAQPVAARDIAGAGAAFVTGLAMGMELDLRSQAEQGVAFAREHLEAFVSKR